MTTLPLASSAASACPNRARLGERGRQLRAAVAGALAQDRAHAAHGAGQPSRRLRGQVVAPGGDVEDRDGIVGHRVANGHAAADPLVEAGAPVLGPADQHRSRGLERGAHPVGPGRPLRPARPRRHVGLARLAQRVHVALDRQDPTDAVGDRHHAAEVLDLGRDRRGGAPEVGEHDLMLERVLGRGLVTDGRRRGPDETRVDVVLLAASVPGRCHLGPHPADPVVAGEKAFASGGHRAVPLAVAGALTLAGPAHPRRSLRWFASSAPRSALLRKRLSRRRSPADS